MAIKHVFKAARSKKQTQKLVTEHKRLVAALRSHDASREDAEANRQEKELHQYESDMSKSKLCKREQAWVDGLKKSEEEGLEKARVDEHLQPRNKRLNRDERRIGSHSDTLANAATKKPGVSKQGAAVRSGDMSSAKEQATARTAPKAPLAKGKNKKEQRAKVFGTDPNGARTSDKRMKMMQNIKQYMKDRHGLDVVTASGKRDESGELREKKPLEKQPYDVFSKKGIAAEKDRQAKINARNEQRKADGKKPIKRVDPKPDWRSGKFETQPSPDAAVHEMAHFYHEPEGQDLKQMQTRMDDSWGESQSKYGHMQQKKTAGEIQPMALENKIRRSLGLPPTSPSKNPRPMSEHDRPIEQTVDGSGPRFTRGVKPGKNGPKSVDFDRSSRLASPETAQRYDKVQRGELQFHPQKGWIPGTTPDAKINQRAREKAQDPTRKDADTLMRSEDEPALELSKAQMTAAPSCKYGDGNGTHMRKSESGGCWYCGQLSKGKGK